MHTVLVVDDSETMQQIVAVAFGYEPFALTPLWSAAEALASAAATRPHLAVVDHGLPDGSGYDVAARLRADWGIPVILLTSEQAPIDAARAAAAGVAAHLQKPFECDDLLVAARAALGIVAAPPPRAAPSPVEATSSRPLAPAPSSSAPPPVLPRTATPPPLPRAAPPPPLPRATTPPLLPRATTPPPLPRATTPPPLAAAMHGVVSATGGAVDGAPETAAWTGSPPRTAGALHAVASPTSASTPGLGLPAQPVPGPPPFLPTSAPGLPNLDVNVSSSAEHQWLHDLLRDAARQGASDIHVHAVGPMRMRRFGTLWSIPDSALPVETVRRALLSLLSEDDLARFDLDGQVDFGLSLTDVGRFRANIYRQQRGTDGVFRVVQRDSPTLSSLSLPPALQRLTSFHQGIVLITGPGASGKSSTMAALLRAINEERSDHVVTIEDPIEVLHPSVRCVVNQRQASRHTKSFARALKAALREDPDVIVIGEMRDRVTAQLALTAAETGHLVLATLHTQSAVATVNRVIGEFPPAQQPNVRAMLSESLRAIVSQRLLPRRDGSGVVPAVELLLNTPAVANLIREQRAHQIRTTMQTGAALGMQTLDASLQELVTQGLIDVEVARRQADDPRAIVAPGAAPPSTLPTAAASRSTLPTPAGTPTSAPPLPAGTPTSAPPLPAGTPTPANTLTSTV